MDLRQRVVLMIVNQLHLRLDLEARDLGLRQALAQFGKAVENDRLLAVERHQPRHDSLVSPIAVKRILRLLQLFLQVDQLLLEKFLRLFICLAVQFDSLPDVSVRVSVGQPRRQLAVGRSEHDIDQVGIRYRLDR